MRVKIGFPNEYGYIRLRDGHSYATNGRVVIGVLALPACERYGWEEVEREGNCVVVERK